MDKRTYVACPTHNGEIRGEIVTAMLDAISYGGKMAFAHQKYSKLTQNFNMLLCDALNRNYSHFCMIHGDVCPEAGWLKKMHEIMGEYKADILSVVLPIKSIKGITSAGYCIEETAPLKLKRLTLQEIHKLPETFTHEHLIVNTGLILIDLKADFMKHVGNGLQFRVSDQILRQPDGKLKAFGGSEDWLFSLDARKLGAKIYSTRAVKAVHYGGQGFNNYESYGIESEEWSES